MHGRRPRDELSEFYRDIARGKPSRKSRRNVYDETRVFGRPCSSREWFRCAISSWRIGREPTASRWRCEIFHGMKKRDFFFRSRSFRLSLLVGAILHSTLSIFLPAARNDQKEHARLEMEQKSGLIDVNVRSTLDKERIYRFEGERTSRNYRVTFGYVSCRV